MRIRSSTRTRKSTSDGGSAGSLDEDVPKTDDGAGRSVLSTLLLLGIGLGALAYVLSRYANVSIGVLPSPEDVQERAPAVETVRERAPSVEAVRERAPSTEAVRERTSEAVPGDFREIPIGERGEQRDDETIEPDADDVPEVLDDEETNVDITDEERSPAEISERADEDVPEPGEMAVDEGVAEELVDEEDLETEDETDGESDAGDADEPE